jgi:hypothetical protein
MTLAQAFVILGPLVLAALAFIGYAAYVHSDLLRLSRYEFWTDHFYSSAKALVTNEETPASVLSLTAELNEFIVDKRAAFALYTIYSQRLRSPSAEKKGLDDDAVTALKKSPDMVEQLDMMMRSGLLAITYTSAMWGVQARAVLADVLSRGSRSTVVQQGVREMSDRAHRASGLVPIISRR